MVWHRAVATLSQAQASSLKGQETPCSQTCNSSEAAPESHGEGPGADTRSLGQAASLWLGSEPMVAAGWFGEPGRSTQQRACTGELCMRGGFGIFWEVLDTCAACSALPPRGVESSMPIRAWAAGGRAFTGMLAWPSQP